MKRALLAALLILALCLSLAACGGKTAENPGTPDSPAVTDAPLDPNSVEGKLAALGFDAKDFVVDAKDYVDIDDAGDFILYSTATYENVAKAIYAACQKAADDGKVRDYWTEEPTDFEFDEASMTFFGYERNGEFEFIAFSPYWTDEDTGYTEFLLQWN